MLEAGACCSSSEKLVSLVNGAVGSPAVNQTWKIVFSNTVIMPIIATVLLIANYVIFISVQPLPSS